MLPYRDGHHTFKTHATFDHIVELHNFDEALRLLVFRQIQRIEIGIRNRFNEFMCSQTGNAFWYLNSSYFGRNSREYVDTINKVRTHYLDSKETFAEHFRNEYYNDYCNFYSVMPPSWIIMELMTFGNLLALLNGITDETILDLKLDRWSKKKIGPDKFKKLTNWMRCIRDVRNHCAHHSRLFNRNFTAPDGIKRLLDKEIELVAVVGTKSPQSQLNRLYTALAAMQVITKQIGLEGMGPELKLLFSKYPEAEKHLDAMGFPEEWQKESLYF